MKEVFLETISTPGCHNCKAFEVWWGTIKADFPNVTYRNIDTLTPEGQEKVSKYGIFVSPGIILDNELFATGGVNKEAFLEKLKELSQ